MINVYKYGELMIGGEIVICSHPGLSEDRHKYLIHVPGIFDVWVQEVSNNCNKPPAVEIQVVKSGIGWSNTGRPIRKNISNHSHGGILIVDKVKLDELGDEFEDSNDVDLWNFFAYGLCSKKPSHYDNWKSNQVGGNIVFVPSWNYHWVCENGSGDGISILCNKNHDG